MAFDIHIFVLKNIEAARTAANYWNLSPARPQLTMPRVMSQGKYATGNFTYATVFSFPSVRCFVFAHVTWFLSRGHADTKQRIPENHNIAMNVTSSGIYRLIVRIWTDVSGEHISIFRVENQTRKKTARSTWLSKQTNSVALCPEANYTGWATATCRRNLVPTFVDRGVSVRRIPYGR
jgi:hypothetical protein